MIRARLRIRLPNDLWVTDLSRRFPDATFELLAGLRTDGRATELGQVHADRPEAVLDALRSHASIVHLDRLEAGQRRALVRYETTDTELYEFVERSTLPVEFPVVATDGWFDLDVTATRDQLDELGAVLEDADVAYELQSVVGTTDPAGVLTERQRELLETALRRGYYEVPRECALSEVADAASIDTSTASTVLRRGEAAVLEWFLTGPGAHGASDGRRREE